MTPTMTTTPDELDDPQPHPGLAQIQQRIRDLGKTQRELASLWEVDSATVSKFLRSEKPFLPADRAASLATFLETSLDKVVKLTSPRPRAANPVWDDAVDFVQSKSHVPASDPSSRHLLLNYSSHGAGKTTEQQRRTYRMTRKLSELVTHAREREPKDDDALVSMHLTSLKHDKAKLTADFSVPLEDLTLVIEAITQLFAELDRDRRERSQTRADEKGEDR